jgi:hypothetical protein
MLTAFKDMIDQENTKISLEDFSLAIYYHITENQISAAKDITQKAIQKYSDNDALYGYL